MPEHTILLITPPCGAEHTNLPRWVERQRQQQQPLGLAVIGSQITHEMPESVGVKILDFYSEIDSTIEDVLKAIDEENEKGHVAIVGISCSSLLLRQVYRLAQLIRSHERLSDVKIALGGPATSHYYDELKSWFLLDAIFIRNGNLSFLEYVKHVIDAQPPPSEGVFVLTNGSYQGALPSQHFLAKSVQSEVPIDYRLFGSTYGFNWEDALADVFTSYGCPYNCAFCSEADSLQYYISRDYCGCRHIDIIRKEVESVRSLRYRRVSIVNDSFLNDTERWRDIVDIVSANGLEFEIRARVDQLLAIGEEGVKTLIDKGLRRIFVGVESSSDESLAFLKKRITVEQITKAFEHLSAGKRHHKEKGYHGEFTSVAYIMLGLKRELPTGGIESETLCDIVKSIWLPFKLKADYAHYATLVLYPGTFLHKESLKKETEDYWRKFYGNPDVKGRLPWYHYRIKRHIIVSCAYFLFYARPKFLRVAIRRMLK